MRKLSTSEKVSRGTLKKSREKANPTYDPLDHVPQPSFELNKDGREYFRQFCRILLSKNMLTSADIPGITRAARWYELYKQADESVSEKGAVQVTATGYTQQTGYFTVMEKSEDRLIKFEALYGMNLTSRMKINLPKPEKKNEFSDV